LSLRKFALVKWRNLAQREMLVKSRNNFNSGFCDIARYRKTRLVRWNGICDCSAQEDRPIQFSQLRSANMYKHDNGGYFRGSSLGLFCVLLRQHRGKQVNKRSVYTGNNSKRSAHLLFCRHFLEKVVRQQEVRAFIVLSTLS
jgi:hypothetical protein